MSQEENLKRESDGPTRVVILGSGYAGVHTYMELEKKLSSASRVEIIMISPHDYLLYLTMVYEVSGGNLPPSSMRQSVRTMLDDPRAHFMQGTATAIDLDNQTVTYAVSDALPDNSDGLNQQSISYDYLVNAIGSETNFFGCPGAVEYAYELKSLRDAENIKNRLLNSFEQAALVPDPEYRRQILSFVIVGGGPTGATLAAKLADLLNNEIRAVFPRLWNEAQITVIEASDKLLGRAGSWFSEMAGKALKEKGVKVLLSKMAEAVQTNGVVCGGELISAKTVIWATGVIARPLEVVGREVVERDEHSGRIKVNSFLKLDAYDNVFVLGDQAFICDKEHEKAYPMRAQFAVRQGRTTGRNIAYLTRNEKLEEFHWQDKGLIISMGEGYSLARVGGYEFSGPLATMAYKYVLLENAVGLRSKLRAGMEWLLNIFLPRDITEL